MTELKMLAKISQLETENQNLKNKLPEYWYKHLVEPYSYFHDYRIYNYEIKKNELNNYKLISEKMALEIISKWESFEKQYLDTLNILANG
jgi:predicted nucleotide-binding protein (sugar kinase/HSP70/actin superfamily)